MARKKSKRTYEVKYERCSIEYHSSGATTKRVQRCQVEKELFGATSASAARLLAVQTLTRNAKMLKPDAMDRDKIRILKVKPMHRYDLEEHESRLAYAIDKELGRI